LGANQEKGSHEKKKKKKKKKKKEKREKKKKKKKKKKKVGWGAEGGGGGGGGGNFYSSLMVVNSCGRTERIRGTGIGKKKPWGVGAGEERKGLAYLPVKRTYSRAHRHWPQWGGLFSCSGKNFRQDVCGAGKEGMGDNVWGGTTGWPRGREAGEYPLVARGWFGHK